MLTRLAPSVDAYVERASIFDQDVEARELLGRRTAAGRSSPFTVPHSYEPPSLYICFEPVCLSPPPCLMNPQYLYLNRRAGYEPPVYLDSPSFFKPFEESSEYRLGPCRIN